MMKYKKIVEEKRDYYIERIERLKQKPLTDSIRGMIVQAEMMIENVNKMLSSIDKFDGKKASVIKWLLSHDFEYKNDSYADYERPEFVKQSTYKQLRVCVNDKGIMILIDPGAGMTLIKNNEFLTPNADRIDYYQFSQFEGKFPASKIAWMEGRASNKDVDEKYFDKLRVEKWIV